MKLLRLWFSLHEPVSPRAYALSGFGLMTELSPYRHVLAPHLDSYLVVRRGEFRLVALVDGRTRLEGRTFYELRVFPAEYWGLWSDVVIHAIHERVLKHIKRTAEGSS